MTELSRAYGIKMDLLFGVDRAVELNTLKNEAKRERKALDNYSQKMQDAVLEQNEYIIEIENMQDEITSLQQDYSKKMQTIDNKYLDLKNKELEGTLTDEERIELNTLEAERSSLLDEGNSKVANLSSSIESSKKAYNGIGNTLNKASKAISATQTTIEGLTTWNNNNSEENGGGSCCTLFIKRNELVINDLSSKKSSVSEQINEYNKFNSFLKN